MLHKSLGWINSKKRDILNKNQHQYYNWKKLKNLIVVSDMLLRTTTVVRDVCHSLKHLITSLKLHNGVNLSQTL